MTKENETLSDKFEDVSEHTEDIIKVKHVKEHTQNAQRRLKEEIKKLEIATAEDTGMDVENVLINPDVVREDINKIFLEEFGDKLI